MLAAGASPAQVEALHNLDAARDALGDDRRLVELVATIASYNMVSRVIVALGIEPE